MRAREPGNQGTGEPEEPGNHGTREPRNRGTSVGDTFNDTLVPQGPYSPDWGHVDGRQRIADVRMGYYTWKAACGHGKLRMGYYTH